MNIKSLLIGSAAALVAVSGARAADAVMAEPEPVEYVKVCDAYGAGFFYIPGTETCLQISGLAWYQVTVRSDEDFGDTPNYESFYPSEPDGAVTNTNIRVNFDARSETEYGTLRSFIRFQTADSEGGYGSKNGYNDNDGYASIDQAYIQLGGFTMGYTESLFTGAIGPYGMTYAGYGSSSWDGLYYGYQQRDVLAYTYKSGSGLFLAASLEDDGGTGDNYAPDVVGLIAYEQAWGGVFATIGYDESADGYTAKIGGQYNFGGGAWWVRAVGTYSDSNNDYNLFSPVGASKYTVLGEVGHKFTDKFTASVAAQYFGDLYPGGSGSDTDVDQDSYAVELNLVYTPVTNFEIRSEIVYQKADGDYIDADGSVSGFLRFTRYF